MQKNSAILMTSENNACGNGECNLQIVLSTQRYSKISNSKQLHFREHINLVLISHFQGWSGKDTGNISYKSIIGAHVCTYFSDYITQISGQKCKFSVKTDQTD